MVAFFFALWAPTLVMGIVFSALKVDGPVYNGQIYECLLLEPALLVLLAFYFVYFLFGLVTFLSEPFPSPRHTHTHTNFFFLYIFCLFVWLVFLDFAAQSQAAVPQRLQGKCSPDARSVFLLHRLPRY